MFTGVSDTGSGREPVTNYTAKSAMAGDSVSECHKNDVLSAHYFTIINIASAGILLLVAALLAFVGWRQRKFYHKDPNCEHKLPLHS